MATRESPVELFYDPRDRAPLWEPFRREARRRARRFDTRNLAFDAGLRLIRTARWLIPGREPPVELYYDPEKLDPCAPRLRVSKEGGTWELRDGEGVLLSRHASLPEALDAALGRAKVCFSEIIVRGSGGRMEWSVSQNPDFVELARALNRPLPAGRGAVA